MLPMSVTQRLRPSPPQHLLLLKRGRKDKTRAKWKPMFLGAATTQMQTPVGAWGGGRGQEAPAEREKEKGIARALRGHKQARNELKLVTGGAGSLGLVPTSTNPP